MASVKKLVEKMHNQPNGVRFDEAAKVLSHYGYKHVRTKGSHHQFRSDNGDLTTVQYGNPIDKSYVKDILERIQK